MRRTMLNPRTWLAPLSLVAIAGCSEIADVGGHIVTYRVNMAGTGTVDSVLYDNGTGTFVKVTAPSASASITVTVKNGGSVEAHIYARGTATPGAAKFAALWMTSTGIIEGDSVMWTTATATPVQQNIAKRVI